MRTRQRSVTIGAAGMMIGSVCPWATAFGFFPMNGLQCRFGWGALLAGALLVTLEARPAWMSRRLDWILRHQRGVTVATSALVILLCLLVILEVSVSGPLLSADWGLYLTLAAAVAVISASVRSTR